jgi:ribonuclease D
MEKESQFSLILTSQDLRDFLTQLERGWDTCPQDERFITIDTEFIRETTYYPQPCLCQIAGPTHAAIVDMLIPEIDLDPLKDLFQDPSILKVFHAARQDLEIFYLLFGQVPTPLFDTQIAAMVCTYGASISYERLVAQTTGLAIDKSVRFTDWAHRPLSEAQLQYAIGDVTHLRDVYKSLQQTLKDQGREAWILEETQALTNPHLYISAPEDSWKRLKIRGGTPRLIPLVQEIAAWREMKAQERNLPRGRILRDDTLVDLATACLRISSVEKIHVRGLQKNFLSHGGFEGLEKAIKKGWARRGEQGATPSSPPSSPAMDQLPIVELLSTLLKIVCQEAGIVPRLVATSAELAQLAQAEAPSHLPPLQGWRYTLFGQKALALKAGKLALSLDKNQIKILDLTEASPS